MQATRPRSLTICLLVALILRLAFIFIGFPTLQQRWQLREDGDNYGLIAQSIYEGRYDDVTRGPVYPVFVALAGTPTVVKVIQALLDVAICGLVYHLANRNLWAAWLWAVYPFVVWRVAFINKEVVLTFLLVSYVCVQLLALRHGKFWQWLAAGGLLGLVNLCKPTFLMWPLVVFGLALANRAGWGRVGVLVAAMLVVVAPWTYRNYHVTHGTFLPVATERGGVTTFIGNYQPTLGLWEGPGKIQWMAAVDEIKRQHAGASVVELDRAFYAAALEQVTSHPAKAAEMFVRKCGRFWLQSAARRERVGAFVIQAGYLAILFVGLRRLWPWGGDTILILALVAYVMLVHALSYADLRFSLPVMPFVCVLASRTLATASAATRTS
jgi:hypothetical protein